jgi:hypothetical protein
MHPLFARGGERCHHAPVKRGGLLGALAILAISSPASAGEEEPICADRPGLATATCTVPAGMVQVESGIVLVRDRSGGIRAHEAVLGETAIVYGVTDRLHIQLDLTPYARLRERQGGDVERASGFGDLVLSFKYRPTSDDALVQIAVNPFVRFPTASRSLGNGKVEGGIIVPIEWDIPRTSLSLTFIPEVALLADSDGSGHHLAIVQAAGIGADLSSRLSVALDLWGQWDLDPAGTIRQYAIGPSAAFLLSNDMQVDAGVDFGLNRHTSDVTVYSGIAVRF